MAHSLIIGMTESGKTTLATGLASYYRAKGIQVMVLDELKDERWQADYITDDESQFIDTFYSSRSCAVFIDEARDVEYTHAMQRTATRGRHWGHNVHFIGQREVGIPPTVRAQCSQLFMFALSYDDRAALAKDFNAPILKTENALQRGEFLRCDKFGFHEKLKVF